MLRVLLPLRHFLRTFFGFLDRPLLDLLLLILPLLAGDFPTRSGPIFGQGAIQPTAAMADDSRWRVLDPLGYGQDTLCGKPFDPILQTPGCKGNVEVFEGMSHIIQGGGWGGSRGRGVVFCVRSGAWLIRLT